MISSLVVAAPSASSLAGRNSLPFALSLNHPTSTASSALLIFDRVSLVGGGGGALPSARQASACCFRSRMLVDATRDQIGLLEVGARLVPGLLAELGLPLRLLEGVAGGGVDAVALVIERIAGLGVGGGQRLSACLFKRTGEVGECDVGEESTRHLATRVGGGRRRGIDHRRGGRGATGCGRRLLVLALALATQQRHGRDEDHALHVAEGNTRPASTIQPPRLT